MVEGSSLGHGGHPIRGGADGLEERVSEWGSLRAELLDVILGRVKYLADVLVAFKPHKGTLDVGVGIPFLEEIVDL
jgi:hypothetical protein